MSLQYTYATGSTIESRRWSLIDDLLVQIPNNNSNLIYASDVRDAVFTLWERTNEIALIAASAASASSFFVNTNPTTIGVGGIPVGSTFPSPQTMQQMFDKLLYPYTTPVLTFTNAGNKEYGASLNSTLNWSVTPKSNPIVSITVNGLSQTPTLTSGSVPSTGTYSLISTPVSTTNTFTMSVFDSQSTTVLTTSYTWMNKIYWGSVNLASLSNPDLTLNPGMTASVGSYITSAIILGLNGAGVSPGNTLSTTKARTYTNINGAGNYLIFAWPSNVAGATTPTFTVNGLQSSAFSRVKGAWTFTNTFGFVTNYEVWVSNTLQNSPLNVIIS